MGQLPENQRRPLREVVSWNIAGVCVAESDIGRPLREVVSWNAINNKKWQFNNGRPLREVVSWNASVISLPASFSSRPLREVVSWNISLAGVKANTQKSTSSWGRELKYVYHDWKLDAWTVDLFVRSWVEINVFVAAYIDVPVDLFVRSWVEIF